MYFYINQPARKLVVLVFLFLSALYTRASDSQLLAAIPPMGWNSWDSYGRTITEDQFKANAKWLHENLQKYGYQYLIIDGGWYLQHPKNGSMTGVDLGFTLSPDGRYLPAPNRFPSSVQNTGFKELASYTHALGLKFGIHILHGIPREAVQRNLPIANSTFHAQDAANPDDVCSWNAFNYGIKANAAGQAYYDSLAKLYADWGIDFLKVDCISRPYEAANAAEVRMIRAALDKTHRPIVLSLSPGPTPLARAEDASESSQMWRISDDLWDIWSSPDQSVPTLLGQFNLLSLWSPHRKDGHWPDPDMLPLGRLSPMPGQGAARYTHFTNDEARTMLTLWSIARSPLILGTNLTEMDAFTLSLVTNPEVLAVDQHSIQNHPVLQTGNTVAWIAKDREAKKEYLAVFNIGDTTQEFSIPWKNLGIIGPTRSVRDLWQRSELGVATHLSITLKAHASILYALTKP